MEEIIKTRIVFSLVLVLALTGLIPTPAQADGIIIPQPIPCGLGKPCPTPCSPLSEVVPCPPPPVYPVAELAVRYHHVTVKIVDQVAVTHVDQVFFNPNDRAIEGDYFFPLPAEAAVSGFTLWIDNEPIKGQVLDADQARQKYNDIVRSLRDPALLEYAGRGAIEAHIYPIPPQGERRIEIEYTQAQTAENGLVHYVYPLNTEKFSTQPLDSVSVSVEISSSQPIRAVYSPTHDIATDRTDDKHVSVSYEGENVRPDTDFGLYYSIGTSEAFHILTYRSSSDPTDPDGFFLLLLAPQPDVAQAPVAKDVILVLDHSGSMDGEKIQQAQAAAKFILTRLNPQDRFDLVGFSSSVETFSPEMQPVEQAAQAGRWIDDLSAQGSTDINRALLEAASLVDKERPDYLIFLTDGLPTEGVTDRDMILKNFAASAPSNLRLFAFGVGYDVDTVLLDTLTTQNHGASAYVKPGDAIDEDVSGFYARISAPVLTDLKLDFGSASAYDVYPSPMPDLFLGSQEVIVGRYRHPGSATVTLTGNAGGAPQTFTFPEQVFTQDSQDAGSTLASLPRLWATRKVGALLTNIRLNGLDAETIQQIVKLSVRYGIVTPYTSYLVTEPQALGVDAQSRIAHDQFAQMQALPTAAASGQAAVQKAMDESNLVGAQAPAAAAPEEQSQVRTVGSRTFVLVDGVWTDTGFDSKTMQPLKVSFLSDDYFKLLQTRPDLAPALALGEQVIAFSGGQVYQVLSAGQNAPALMIASPAPTQVAKMTATAQPIGAAGPRRTSTPASAVGTASATPAMPDRASSQADLFIPAAVGAIVLSCAALVLLRKKL